MDLVEDGPFLFASEKTQNAVDGFIERLFQQHPLIDVLTLSSTHLPWLRSFFERARPDCEFLDPAAKIVAELGCGSEGAGIIHGLVTEDGAFDLKSFRAMLLRIGVDIPLEVVTIGWA